MLKKENTDSGIYIIGILVLKVKRLLLGKKIEIQNLRLMKKMMILVSAIMMVANVNAKSVETASFNEVRVNVPARLRIVSGDSYSVSIAASDVQVANAIRADVKDGVLSLTTRNIEELGEAVNSLTITVVTPSEPTLTMGADVQIAARK